MGLIPLTRELLEHYLKQLTQARRAVRKAHRACFSLQAQLDRRKSVKPPKKPKKREHPGNVASIPKAVEAWKTKQRQAAEKLGVLEVPEEKLNKEGKLDPKNLPDRYRTARRPRGRPKGVPAYKGIRPECPHCGGYAIKRAGFSHHKDGVSVQRWKCGECGRSFNGPGFRIKDQRPINLVCYRCGRENCNSSGKVNSGAGRVGICPTCKRSFTQGGREDLTKYHLVLETRIREKNLPDKVERELLQLAYMDVLEGFGYCWNVPLRISDAKRLAYGEYKEVGEHSIFRRQNESTLPEE